MSQNRYWNLLAKKLAGEASPEEVKELEQLMKENPEWVFPSEHIESLWKLAPKTDHYDTEIAFEAHLEHLKDKGIHFPELDTPLPLPGSITKHKPLRKRYGILFAGIILVSFGIAYAFLWSHTSSKQHVAGTEKKFSEVSTRPGSKTRLVLPDSTVVWLNAGSRLSYNEQFGTSNRNTILSGEAFFDVKKDKIPFIIHANSVQIRVMGTAFNVKSYPNEKTTETSLIRGRVEITLDKRPGETYILKPNEKLTVANEPEIIRKEDNLKTEPIVVLSGLTEATDHSIIETSWVDNKLVFQDESLAELSKRMERWYGVAIELKDEKIGKERFSGTFTTESIEQALEELQMITAFHFTIKSNSITITQ